MKIHKNYFSKFFFTILVAFLAIVFLFLLNLLNGCSGINLSVPALRAQGFKAEKEKQYPKGIRIYKQLIKINPKDDQAYTGLGHCVYHLSDYEKAIAYLTEAIKLNPKNDRAFDLRGLCKYKQKNYEAAIVDYEKALSLNSNNPHTEEDLGDCYKQIGNNSKALEHLFKAQTIYSQFNLQPDLKRVAKKIEAI